MGKIICVGFQKTGTSSITSALKALGFSVGDPTGTINKTQDWRSENLNAEIVQKTIDSLIDVDAIQDSPCAFVYRELDQAWPGSKFILTLRDADSWLKSYERYFADQNNDLRKWMYGVDRFLGNEAVYREVFDTKNAEIIEYFKDRPQDFMTLDLQAGEGWIKLVNFLGPEFIKKFPHENRQRS